MKTIVRAIVLLLILAFVFGCDPITTNVDPDPDEEPPPEEPPEEPPEPGPSYSYVVTFPDGTVVGFMWDGTNMNAQPLAAIPTVSDIIWGGVSIEDITYTLDGAINIHLSLLMRNIGPYEITGLEFFCKFNFSNGTDTYGEFIYFENISPNQLNIEDDDSNIVGPAESIEFLQVDFKFYYASSYYHYILDLPGYYTFYPPY